MAKQEFLRLPVVSAGAEHLVMGYLMRWNILTYKAPPNNEGYDLICIHPDPKHKANGEERELVRVQVKSRYATDCDRGLGTLLRLRGFLSPSSSARRSAAGDSIGQRSIDG